jgi:hypothetical protein
MALIYSYSQAVYSTDYSQIDRRIAQTFYSSKDANVTHVVLPLSIDNDSGTGTYIVAIYGTTAGLPSGSALASYSLQLAPLTETSEQITIPLSAKLNKDTTYAIVAYISSSVRRLQWGYSENPTYTFGSRAISSDAGANWTADTNIDFIFEVHGTYDVTHGQKELRNDWDELTASDDTKYVGHTQNLIPEKSFVNKKYKKGL